jgi:hypothetical protein
MGWLEILRTGWDAVRGHRLRSALTMLGILIGSAGVVMTVGLGEGAQQKRLGVDVNCRRRGRAELAGGGA